MRYFKEDDIIHAHGYSLNNMPQLSKDKLCGCFYCKRIFHPSEISEYVEDTSGTAICPYCDVDAVIGESAGYPITEEFLTAMYRYWFE